MSETGRELHPRISAVDHGAVSKCRDDKSSHARSAWRVSIWCRFGRALQHMLQNGQLIFRTRGVMRGY